MRTRPMLAVSALTLAVSGMVAAPAAAAQAADLDCANFTTQAEAQAVFDADPSDPNRLDRDNDGLACESLPGGGGTVSGDQGTATTNASPQVAPMPAGGAATGAGTTVGLEHEGLLVTGGLAALVGAGGLVMYRRRLSE